MIWAEGHSLPLFQSPGNIAVRSNLANFGAAGIGDLNLLRDRLHEVVTLSHHPRHGVGHHRLRARGQRRWPAHISRTVRFAGRGVQLGWRARAARGSLRR